MPSRNPFTNLPGDLPKPSSAFIQALIEGRSISIARAKEEYIREHIQPYIAAGYDVDDFGLQETQNKSRDPALDRIELVCLNSRSPLSLWARRAWRRFRPYRYALALDRRLSYDKKPDGSR